jgi:SHAQKYF class myb-like DNA-binding protein
MSTAPTPVPDPTATTPPLAPPAPQPQVAAVAISSVTINSTPATPAVETTQPEASPKPVAAPVVPATSAPPAAPTIGQPVTPVPSAASPKSASSKLKKKKDPVIVTMATAATAQAGGLGAQGENTGRWTAEEHRLFLQGLEQHGKGWKKIASLIKSRTVVQIRTHAQKYFQKLAKARQNGEEGDVSMEGRGGIGVLIPSVSTLAAQSSKRRRQTSGTKRKAIQSVVSSAQRQGKKIAAAQAASGVPNPTAPLPAVAPALSHYIIPTSQPSHPDTAGAQPCVSSITTAQGAIFGPALEDSLYVVWVSLTSRD